MTAPDPAWVEAAVQALRQCDPGYDLEDDFHLPTLAWRLIAAVEPLIRADVLADLKARVEGLRAEAQYGMKEEAYSRVLALIEEAGR